MIIAKPKKSTLFSIAAFLVLTLTAIAYTANSAIHDEVWSWYHYLVFVVLSPIALGILLRTLFNYKVVRIGKGKAMVRYPLRLRRYELSFKELKDWKETKIKTGSGMYRELEVSFDNGKQFTISLQEHSDYHKAINYMKKKHSQKEVK